jgi:hypothetical protein
MDFASKQLLLHGSIVLLIGLLTGVPYGRAINNNQTAANINGWRVAHGALCMGATTMIAIAAALSFLQVDSWLKWAIVINFVVSGYAFSLVLPMGAHYEVRGLSSTGSRINRFVYVGNTLAALTSLFGTIGLILAVILSK